MTGEKGERRDGCLMVAYVQLGDEATKAILGIFSVIHYPEMHVQQFTASKMRLRPSLVRGESHSHIIKASRWISHEAQRRLQQVGEDLKQGEEAEGYQ